MNAPIPEDNGAWDGPTFTPSLEQRIQRIRQEPDSEEGEIKLPPEFFAWIRGEGPAPDLSGMFEEEVPLERSEEGAFLPGPEE